MSGVVVTTQRAGAMLFSESYLDETLGLMVADHRRDQFASWDAIRDLGAITILAPDLPYYVDKLRELAPHAVLRLQSLDQPMLPLTDASVDAVWLPAERGSAWTLMFPEYSVVVPGPTPIHVPLAFPIGKRDERFASFINTWIALKRKDGTLDARVQALDSRAGRRAASAALVHHSQRPPLGGVTALTEPPNTSRFERVLNLLTVVRPGEARTALLLALNVFLILMAYYILKTVREALILGEGTAELKSYLSAGQVVTLAFVVPFYGRLVGRFPRMTLIIGDFYAKYFSMANALGLFLQLFVVSHIIRHRGVAVAVMILPALSFGAYNVLAFVPLLNAALAAKVVENSTDYSLNNTVRNMLFLPCTYEQKFAAKQAIDSFFVRMGDVLSAALVFAGTSLVVLPSRGFAAVNAALAVVALILAWRVGRYYKTLTASSTAAGSAAA